MNRRQLLKTFFLLPLISNWEVAFAFSFPSRYTTEHLVYLRLHRMFSDSSQVRLLGNIFLTSATEMAERKLAQVLLHDLSSVVEKQANQILSSDDEFQKAITASVQRDFEQNRIVDVEGWRLSRTEALMSALVALSDRKSR